MVKILREEEKADIVICLSHSGLHENPSHSEDEILASKIDGIDIIISGHTHTPLMKPILVNDIIIVQAWAYGRHVGVLDVVFDNGKLDCAGYRIRTIDDTDGNGLPDVPEKYNGKLGRIIMVPSWNPVYLLTRGTWITWSVFALVLVLVLATGLIAFLVIRRLKRKKTG